MFMHLQICQETAVFSPYLSEIMQESLFQYLTVCLFPWWTLLSAAPGETSEVSVCTELPLPIPESDLVSFRIQSEWAVFGKKLLYEGFYRKHWEKNIWNWILLKKLSLKGSCQAEFSSWTGGMPTALLLCSRNVTQKKKKNCRVSKLGAINVLRNSCNWIFFHRGYMYVYSGHWSCAWFE